MGRVSAGTTIDALNLALSRTSLRGELLANNLANVNTPGYKRLDLAFDDILASISLDSKGTAAAAGRGVSASLRPAVTSAGHIAGTAAGASASAAAQGPQATRAGGTTLRNDGNNVDIEAEMALLAENSLYYQALVRETNNRLSALRLAITEGRR